MNPNARAHGEWLLGTGQQLERDVQRARRRPSGASHGDVAAIEFLLSDAHEREGCAATRSCLIRVLAVHLDRADADLAVQRQQPHGVARGYRSAPGRSGDDRPGTRQREHAIDR